MLFYRLQISTDLNEVGVFPQIGEMKVGLHKDDPKHLFNQADLSKLSAEIYIPSFKLQNKAKLTDVLSFPINNDWVVSEKLKSVFESENIADVQFIPIEIFKKEELKNYFLLRPLKSSIEQIDFSKTEISIMKTTWDEEQIVKVRDVQGFLALVEETKYPMSIKIKRPYILQDCNLKFFCIKYVYGIFPYFISKEFRDILVNHNITGIRYMELDEIL
jgi:hypothetical protein